METGETPYAMASRMKAQGSADADIISALKGQGVDDESIAVVLNSVSGAAAASGYAQSSGYVDRVASSQQYGGGQSYDTSDDAPAQSSSVPGWVWFILIYGVGNAILYSTTGILLIPIPRR